MKERNNEYRQQLENDAKRVVSEFLANPEYAMVKQEYALHFDEIKATIYDPRTTLRTCVEDIMCLSPVIKRAINAEPPFFLELHRAIKEGMLTRELL